MVRAAELNSLVDKFVVCVFFCSEFCKESLPILLLDLPTPGSRFYCSLGVS